MPVKMKMLTIGTNNHKVYIGFLPINFAHSTKFTPGISPLIAGTPALGNKRYKLMLKRIYDTIRNINMVTFFSLFVQR
jgi:hypothetical protein